MRLGLEFAETAPYGPTRGNFRQTETNTPQIFFFAD
jgi:hypothetical protein